MSAAALQILAAFDALPAADRDEVVAALLTRHPVGSDGLPDDAFVEVADELFQEYDAAEAADATPAG